MYPIHHLFKLCDDFGTSINEIVQILFLTVYILIILSPITNELF